MRRGSFSTSPTFSPGAPPAASPSCTVTCKWATSPTSAAGIPTTSAPSASAVADEGFARIGTEVVDPGTPLLRADRGRRRRARPQARHPVAGLDRRRCRRRRHRRRARRPDRLDGLCFRHLLLQMMMTTAAWSGVWGPLRQVPGAWPNQGGESAAGAAIDHLVTLHPAAARPARTCPGGKRGRVAGPGRHRRCRRPLRRRVAGGDPRRAGVPRQPVALRRSGRAGARRPGSEWGPTRPASSRCMSTASRHRLWPPPVGRG